MIEFIEGLIVGVLVTLSIFAYLRKSKKNSSKKQLYTPVVQRSYDNECGPRLHRLELGRSPTELSKEKI